MSFVKYLLPAWRRLMYEKTPNSAILQAIDKVLKQGEEDALEGKFVMNLKTSTGLWLDQYGDIFGLSRKDDETDDQFRNRIIEYVQLDRGTNPAIKRAIQAFLQDYTSNIHIYEPYRDVFTLNQSKLNGKDHLLGEYYTFAVIDITISRPFPDGIEEVIKEFKPAGVVFVLTYKPDMGTNGSEVVESPYSSSAYTQEYSSLETMNGLRKKVNGHISLTDSSRKSGDNSGLFILNESKLNSGDRLAGSYAASNDAYNLAGYAETNIVPTSTTTISDMISQTESVSPDFYTRTGIVNDSYALHTVNGSISSYLHFTMDAGTYLSVHYPDSLREVEPSGVYTKSTYQDMMRKAKIQYDFKSLLPVGESTNFVVQIFDVSTGGWVDLKQGRTSINRSSDLINIPESVDFLTEDGLLFLRLRLGISSRDSYPFHLHFLDVGFQREIGTGETTEPMLTSVSSSASIS